MRGALTAAAATMGEELVTATRAGDTNLLDFLSAQGFAPYQDGKLVRLRNCPFHLLARDHTEVICGMNLAMLEATTARLAPEMSARLDPSPDRCCVAIGPR